MMILDQGLAAPEAHYLHCAYLADSKEGPGPGVVLVVSKMPILTVLVHDAAAEVAPAPVGASPALDVAVLEPSSLFSSAVH